MKEADWFGSSTASLCGSDDGESVCLAIGSVVPLPYWPGHTEQGWGRGGLPESWEYISHTWEVRQLEGG